MRYASLASGSKGNCHAFSDGESTLLVDVGISFLQIRRRLEALDWDLEQVRAVAITHEHSDHIAAIPVLLKRTDWKFMATEETMAAILSIQDVDIPASRWIPLRAGHALDWEGWRVLPFAIPHDAADPVGYRLELGGHSAAVVTDLGHPTALVLDHCSGLDHLTLESNHDVQMLREGSYPPPLKARILSRVGHLSNEAAAGLLDRVWSPRLASVVLAHLSEQNNEPELARFAATEVLRHRATRLVVATQGTPLPLSLEPSVPRDGIMMDVEMRIE
ncbi:MBL fold metallo-hydrolase [Holophaga foetida]|uniref:MBL fold metallo-hydrolase n=1 Tax=Holophaga foetida TaxID=35839 RepID=UPI00024749EB|nr:MBL fold metallo-hydrolase [Holophaga foetida]